MTVRCKFRCDEITVKKGWNPEYPLMHSVVMNPVMPPSNQPDHENKKFWEASPGGTFKLDTIKPQAFEVGKEYYIDITEAPSS